MFPLINKNVIPIWHKLIEKIKIINSCDDEKAFLKQLATSKKTTSLGFLNAHGFNMVVENEVFYDSIHGLDIILRDGSGCSYLYKLLSKQAGLNMNGTDLIPKILQAYKGRKMAVFGTQSPFIEQASEIITKKYQTEVLTIENGFCELEHYIKLLDEHHPDLILLGMGMPKQEQLAALIKEKYDYPCLIVCGGAILDFISGRCTRAYPWMRALGIEWIYRLALEPKRLFNRYIIGNFKFLLRAFYYKLQT